MEELIGNWRICRGRYEPDHIAIVLATESTVQQWVRELNLAARQKWYEYHKSKLKAFKESYETYHGELPYETMLSYHEEDVAEHAVPIEQWIEEQGAFSYHYHPQGETIITTFDDLLKVVGYDI